MPALSRYQLEGMKELALFFTFGIVLALVTFKISEIVFSLWSNTRKYKKSLYNRLFPNWISEEVFFGCLFESEGKWYEASLFNKNGFSPRIHLTISCYVEGEMRVIHSRPIVWLFRSVSGQEIKDRIQELNTSVTLHGLKMVHDPEGIKRIEKEIGEVI